MSKRAITFILQTVAQAQRLHFRVSKIKKSWRIVMSGQSLEPRIFWSESCRGNGAALSRETAFYFFLHVKIQPRQIPWRSCQIANFVHVILWITFSVGLIRRSLALTRSHSLSLTLSLAHSLSLILSRSFSLSLILSRSFSLSLTLSEQC